MLQSAPDVKAVAVSQMCDWLRKQRVGEENSQAVCPCLLIQTHPCLKTQLIILAIPQTHWHLGQQQNKKKQKKKARHILPSPEKRMNVNHGEVRSLIHFIFTLPSIMQGPEKKQQHSSEKCPTAVISEFWFMTFLMLPRCLLLPLQRCWQRLVLLCL